MRFVLGNRLMTGAGGTEVHLATVADQLRRLGHDAVIYSLELGAYAEHVRERGFDVLDAVHELPQVCDAVLAQDTLVAYDLAERYPDAFHVFRVCGDSFDFQHPPQLDGIADLVIALSDRYERIARQCAADTALLRLRVPIDIDRLVPFGPPRERPRRAVLLGNYADRHAIVRAAWEPHGIEVVQVGGPSQRFDIAGALIDADIVVAKSRAALDAMACGRPVYVFDTFGGDGWVTRQSYPALEADNFAGQATGRVLGASDLEADLGAYDARMGVVNRDLVIQHHNPRDHVLELLEAIEARKAATRSRPERMKELARLTRLQFAWEQIARERQHTLIDYRERVVAAELAASQASDQLRVAHAERDMLAGERDLLAAERDALRARVQALERTLREIQATRAWRAATALYRWRQTYRR